MAKFLMVAGTASNVGKTLLSACLCEIGRRNGINIAPFKAQNMCNETVVQEDGSEVSAAQWLQADARGISVHTNPILVKPSSLASSLYVRGRLVCEDYMYPGPLRHRNRLRGLVLESAMELGRRNDVVVIEGAGAFAETNLAPFDLANSWLAKALSSDVVLVSDLERGGAFSSIAGTKGLLASAEAEMVTGFILNRFVGRSDVLKPAISSLEHATSWPCLGVLPKLCAPSKLPWEDILSKPINNMYRANIIVIDLPFETSGGELSTLAIDPKWTLTYAKFPPAEIPLSVRLLVVPDCTPSEEAYKLLWLWFPLIERAKKIGISIIALGFGFHALSRHGLGLFNVKTCALLTPAPVKVFSYLFGVSFSSTATTICYESKSAILLQSNDVVWGIQDGNTFGIGLTGSLLHDEFRYRLLVRSNLIPSIIHCQRFIRNSLKQITLKIIPYIDVKLFARLFGR